MAKNAAFHLSSHVFEGSYQAEIPIILQSDRLQIPTMEDTTQSMHEQLRGELGKFRKFQRIGLFEILSQIGKGGGY